MGSCSEESLDMETIEIGQYFILLKGSGTWYTLNRNSCKLLSIECDKASNDYILWAHVFKNCIWKLKLKWFTLDFKGPNSVTPAKYHLHGHISSPFICFVAKRSNLTNLSLTFSSTILKHINPFNFKLLCACA